jgi:hypothetical protein
MSCGFTRTAVPSSSAAPANSLSSRTPRLSTREATYSLRDQVHAVAQSRDQHDVRREEQRDHLLAGVRLVQVPDGGVPHGVEVAVDAPHGQLDLIAQLDVGGDALPAGAGDLHERDVLDAEPLLREQLAVGLQPVSDALGVVEAIDAEEDALRVAEALADLPGTLLHIGAPCQLDVRRRVDRDRERLRERAPRSAIGLWDCDPRGFGLVAQLPSHGSGEVAGIRHPLESDHVGAEQSLQHLPTPRQLRVEAVCREGNVVEVADHEVGAQVAQHPRNELQLVVLHPDRGTVIRGCGCRLRESAVHPHVGVPPDPAVPRLGDHVMVERPDGVVREALVIELHVLSGQHHGDEQRALELEGLQLDVRLAGPADPRAVGLLHDRLEAR